MPIALNPDFDARRLRAAACASKVAGQTQRFLALAAVYEGTTRTEAVRIGGATLQIVCDWVLKLCLNRFQGICEPAPFYNGTNL